MRHALIVICVLCVAAVLLGSIFHPPAPPPYTAPEYEMQLLAEDRGVRVYRLSGPKIVVPRIIVVGKDGKGMIE